MIFISGVHGVGKSYFCEEIVKAEIEINIYSASTLISAKKKSGFSSDKLIPNIDDNQQYLLQAVNELRATEGTFILDGHFCLLNADGQIQRIRYDTFMLLRPEVILLLTEDPEIIVKRRQTRDNQNVTIDAMKKFQDAEVTYASEVAKALGSKFFICRGSADLDKAIQFIKSC